MVLQSVESMSNARHHFCKAYANMRERRRDKAYHALDERRAHRYVGDTRTFGSAMLERS
jgi:hypothetical protein